MVQALGGGFGSLALAQLHASAATVTPTQPLLPHFAPKAKHIIHLFMNGGPFQCDLFDPKPALNKFAGQKPPGADLRTERPTGALMGVPFKFSQHGQSGLPISELLPNLSRHADDLCVIRSMHTDNPNHGPALFLMNNGSIVPTRPTLGAWLSYGLGSENQNLPNFVVFCPGRPVRFSELWSNGFLPGEHQGTYINHSNLDPRKMIPFLENAKLSPANQTKQIELMRQLNQEHSNERNADPALEARIRSMETAYRMQLAASDAFDISLEPTKTREMYGKGHFANGCLLARRLAERGVRFTQLYYGNGQPWDTHSNHTASTRNLCKDIDQPIAALLTDLKNRGLLDETLVVWGGEFGRTPTTENADGRDHNPWGFSMFMAGGGVKGGQAYGATDDFGFKSVENKVHIHDLHATILHLMGLDHEKLTYRYAGRDFRLTDVSGHVVSKLLQSPQTQV
ncbi:MAG: DUF1501 domain-containing protein [Gemmataceae bacterium]|nr:DUF1501 domain-containing protein [Gemmataceae bacterium]MBJ7496225.1 DUF1501 domain-containing protein [Gemmataceae bacterium]